MKIFILTFKRGLIASLFALLFFTACGEEAIPEDNVPELGVITTDNNLLSLNFGATATIGINPVTSTGSVVPFTATTAGNCATMTVTASAINIVAPADVNLTCTQIVTVKASGFADKNITINVLDPMTMDIGEGLLIKYVNTYVNTANNPSYPHSVHKPVVEAGWHALGSYVHSGIYDTSTATANPMIIVKDSKNANLIVAPTDYTFMTFTTGSYFYTWKPTCPSGYVPMGFVSGLYTNKPSTDDVVCVREDFTAKGTIDTANAQGYEYTYYYPITSSDTYVGTKAQLPAGTFVACDSPTTCDAAMINTLVIPLDPYNTSENGSEPLLTDNVNYNSTKPKYSSSIRLPFTLIASLKTDTTNFYFNVTESPFYELKRVEVYQHLSSFDNMQGHIDSTQNYTTLASFDQTQASSFSQSVGLEVGITGSAKFAGIGVEASVKVTASLGWSQSTATSYGASTSITTNYTIPAGKFGEIVQVSSSFLAVGNTGLELATPLTGGSSSIKYLQYPRE